MTPLSHIGGARVGRRKLLGLALATVGLLVACSPGSSPCVQDNNCGRALDAGASVDAGGPFPAFRTCVPPGSTQIANGGLIGPTMPPTSCQKPVGTSNLSGAQKIALGTHTVNETLRFVVPPSVGGLSVIQQAVRAVPTVSNASTTVANAAVPTRLLTPTRRLLYDDRAAAPRDATTAFVWYQTPAAVNGVMTIPATSAMLGLLNNGSLPEGTWSVTVNDYANECAATAGLCTSGTDATGQYDVSVLFRRGPVPTTGTARVAFYLVTNNLTAASAMTDRNVARMLETMTTLFARAGICLGDVTFYDVPAWAKAKYATGVDANKTEACDALGQMFTLSRPDDNALNFFLVDDIAQSSSPGGTVIGLDGAIPGPSSVGGTVKSGAIVNVTDLPAGTCSNAMDVLNCGADEVGYIASHEAGHWLGLYHTTETNGLQWDPLTDTPKCTCDTACVGAASAARCCDLKTLTYPDGSACSANFTAVDGNACSSPTEPSCQGADNLMFWVLDQHSVGNISSQQSLVMRSNPLVQ